MNGPTLDDLRDIHLPPEPGLWPPAPGGWLVAAALALLVVVVARRHARRRPLRAALRELDAIEAAWRSEPDPVRLARGLSQLLRRYALWRYPALGVAGLIGRDWLDFLDEHGGNGGNGEFARGVGAVLESLPYRPERPAAASDDGRGAPTREPLIALVRRWLQVNSP